MTVAKLKTAAREVRRIRGHRMPPYTEDLCALVEALDDEAVMVPRHVLVNALAQLNHLFGEQHGCHDVQGCDDKTGDAITALEGVLR